jgi:hypothetical protein
LFGWWAKFTVQIARKFALTNWAAKLPQKIACLLRLCALVGTGTPSVTGVVAGLLLGTLVKQDTLRKGYA